MSDGAGGALARCWCSRRGLASLGVLLGKRPSFVRSRALPAETKNPATLSGGGTSLGNGAGEETRTLDSSRRPKIALSAS